jgi:ABC-2 type transport system ATP-binding protein
LSSERARKQILEIKCEGRTVLLTTDHMEEADQPSDRVGLLDHEKIIALDTPTNLTALVAQSVGHP